MRKKIRDLFNVIKYKRKYNKMQNNYKSALEEIDPLKTQIIELQRDKIVLLERYNDAKKIIKELKKEGEKNGRKKKTTK